MLLLAITVVRDAAVRVLEERDPGGAARVWSGHPSAEFSQGMVAIANAARDQRPVPSTVLQSIYAAAATDPLAPEPFLVRGVQAQLAGDSGLARNAFTAARWRDPRSLPARYFLADDDFRRGDSVNGLREVVALARLAPAGVGTLAPYLATYALDRSNWPQLRGLFHSDPRLAGATFASLARDGQADVILALADRGQLGPDTRWLPALLAGLVNAGRYDKARQVWAQVAGLRLDPRQLLFDPGFSRADPPPPFNWALTASTVGLAERRPGGGLHVIYYGQEDGVLASQLIVLAPGSYRVSMRKSVNAPSAASLQWRLMCASPQVEIATAPLETMASRGLDIAVRPGCEAQRLELFGTSSDMPQQVDVTIPGLDLVRERAGG